MWCKGYDKEREPMREPRARAARAPRGSDVTGRRDRARARAHVQLHISMALDRPLIGIMY